MEENTIIQEGEINVLIKDSFIGTINISTKKEFQKKLTYTPVITNEEVIGRREDLRNVYNLLETSKRVVLVNGLGGIGKTTLAKFLVNEYENTFNHIVWLNTIGGIKETFVRELPLLDNLYLREDIEKIDPKRLIDEGFELVINRLRKLKGNNLLIIDNVSEDIEHSHILDKIALKPDWKVLVTSREKLVGFSEYELGLLSPDEAKELFYLHYKYEKNDLLVEEILKVIDFHTLLIETLSKTAQSLRLSLIEILDRLKKKGLNISQEATIKFPHNYNQKVINIFEYFLEIFKIADLSEYEQWILRQFSVLPSVYIPYFEKEETSILKFLQIENGKERDVFTKALNRLERKGWLQLEDSTDTFKMHNLIQEVLRFKLVPTVSDCKQLIEYFRETLKLNHKAPIIKKQIFTPFTESLVQKINESNLLLADLANFLDDLYEKLGDYKKSEKYSLMGLKMLDDAGIEYFNQNRATFYNNLAETYRHLGNLNNSISYATKAVEIREKILHEFHPLLASSYNNLANSYIELGDYKNALRIELKVSNIRDKAPISFDSQIDMATTYNNLASIYFNLKNYYFSLNYNEAAISIREKYLPIEHEDLAQSYNNIGVLYSEMGNVFNAIEYLEKSLKINKKINPKHPETARSLCNLGVIYVGAGNISQGLDYLLKGTKIREEVLEETHQDLAHSYATLSTIYIEQRDMSKALMYINKAVDICEKIFPQNHPNYIQTVNQQMFIRRNTF